MVHSTGSICPMALSLPESIGTNADSVLPKILSFGLMFASLDFTAAFAYSAHRSTFAGEPIR